VEIAAAAALETNGGTGQGDERAALDGGGGALCSTKTKTKATAQIQI